MTIVNLDRVTASCVVAMEYEERVSIGDTVLVRRTRATDGQNSASRSFGSRDDAKLTGVTPQADIKQETFVGVVTFISPVKLADDTNSFEIEAVVQNKSTGLGKFLLREGSYVEARIIPQR